MGGKSQPNMGQAAIAQGEANAGVVRDQTYANRPEQYTPWGFTSWNPYQYTDPGSGEQTTRWEQTQGLTPELQSILDKQIAITGGKSDVAGNLVDRMASEFGQPMDWSGLNPLAETPQMQMTGMEGPLADPYQTRQRAEDAMYNSARSRIDPKFASQREAQEIKMRNMGLRPGDAAYDAAMEGIGTQETDALNQAQWGATTAGRAESGQMFGQGLAANQNRYQQALGSNAQNFQQQMATANYSNTIRQQQLTEAMTKRGFSLNEINALMSGGQVQNPQMPNFSQAGSAAPAPIYTAAADQASMAAAANPMNALIGAGADIGAAYMTGGFAGRGAN